MEKINIVLVLLNSEKLEATLKNINLDNVNLVAIALDNAEEKFFKVGEKKVPIVNFSAVHDLAKKYKEYFWLIGGSDGVAAYKLKNFLMTFGISKDNIINAQVPAQISETLLANLRHIKEYGADFFATGNGCMQSNLNLKFIPRVNLYNDDIKSGGVILANVDQTLQQSYLIAKEVFEHVKPNTIKFVLIGLEPTSFLRANDFEEENFRDNVKNIFATPAAQVDLNFDTVKEKFNNGFSIKSVIDWEDDTKFLTVDVSQKNTKILKDYVDLCLANGAKPVGVVFPFAPAMRNNFDKELLINFRETIHQLEENCDFICVDMFNLNLNYNCFCDMTHLNPKGAQLATAFLSLKLYQQNLLPLKNFLDMTYEYLDGLSAFAPKGDYNAFLEKIFKVSAQMISRKKKIRVGFVLRTAAEWSGDDLYNLFANDERFEPTIFLCLSVTQPNNEIAKSAFLRGVEQFKSHGLNIVPMDNWKAKMPAQDVMIFLTPYFTDLTRAFRLKRITAKTLIAHITYSFTISLRGKKFYNKPMFNIAWKVFISSIIGLNLHRKKSDLGMPRSLYSGYPRIDPFFRKDSDFQFDWKMTRPDAKKIIYAPHWSINAGVKFATFQWNYKFMYEFAKAHPEISWVVKPHPALASQAVAEKLFPSIEAFKEYMQAWDDLPNARVYTGAYYQAIFATSDGMIHDSGSFIAEYQFVDKPMIYLTRAGEVFNDLGNEILKISYLVDGKDLDTIAAMIQRVFIASDDYRAAERKKVFDKYLNYPKINGMLASEFIYKSITDELQEAE